MSDEQDKDKVVEWSFSFDKLGDSINEQIRKMGIGDEEVKHNHFSTGLGDASSASIDLDLSVGRVSVHPLTNAENLIEADVAYVGEMRFEVSGDADKKVRLGQKRTISVNGPLRDAMGMIVKREDLRWDIGLSPKVPLNFNVNGGVGETRLDLSTLKLARLRMNGGVGETRLTLPATDEQYSAKIKGGVGALYATITPGTAVKLDIEGGVGGVNVQLTAGAAVRVQVEGGLGGVSLPSSFKRVKGGSDFISTTGVWETEGYALASQQIRIDFKGGVGGFKANF